jgi:citrate lyase subunit beta/citryl-CoA lyase
MAENTTRGTRASSLLVRGDDPQHIAGAGRFDATQVVFDLGGLEPADKDTAREAVAAALQANHYGDALIAVRINPIDAMWAYRDIVDIVERAGEFVDGIVVPDVTSAADITFVDTLLGMIEQRIDCPHRIAVDAEIANAQALALLDEIALASDRLEALILQESATLRDLGADPSDPLTAPAVSALRVRVVAVARAVGMEAVASPPATSTHPYREAIAYARALGYDGARAAAPAQVKAANAVFGAR